MRFNNNNASVRIVKTLGLKGFHNGNPVSWHWKRKMFAKRFDFRKRMNPHMVIVGQSGGGKSNASKVIIRNLCDRGHRVMILDPNGDYLGIADYIGARVYDASRTGINIFDTDGMAEEEKVAELVSLFSRRLKLGHVQSSTLRRCMQYCYWYTKGVGRPPTAKDLLYTISVFRKRATGAEARTLATLSERLSLLSQGSFFRTVDAEKAASGNSIFLLSTLHTEEAQAVYMEGLLRKAYGIMLAGRYPGPAYIVVDEARKIAGSSVLGRLAAEGRKYGIGVITISQRAREIDGNVAGNSSLLVSFYQREPSELNYVSNFIAGGNELNRFAEVKRAIRNLRTGEAIALDSSRGEPMILRFGLSESRKTSLEHLLLSLASCGMKEELMASRARAAGFSETEITEKAAQLSKEGLLSTHKIQHGRMSGNWCISYNRNSAEHDLAVNLISRKLSANGIRNEIRNSSYGPDIVAYSSGRTIAIEYETGKKELSETAAMIRKRSAKYAETVVVVNDSSHEKYAGMEGITLVGFSSFFER